MSGIGLAILQSEEATASENADEAAAEGREHKSALLELLEVCVRACVRVCVCVFIKLHITAQSGPVILVILCHVCVCVCVYLLSCT